jgi:hypothetical protein
MQRSAGLASIVPEQSYRQRFFMQWHLALHKFLGRRDKAAVRRSCTMTSTLSIDRSQPHRLALRGEHHCRGSVHFRTQQKTPSRESRTILMMRTLRACSICDMVAYKTEETLVQGTAAVNDGKGLKIPASSSFHATIRDRLLPRQ